MARDFLPVLSMILGWTYVAAWSLSFYPQPILNFRRRSTIGSTVDFPFINVLGFIAYLISNAALYYSPVIRSQYAARHDGQKPTVQFNDVVFAAHALLISSITLSQYFFPVSLWGFPKPPSSTSRPSRFITGIFTGCVLAMLGIIIFIGGQEASATIFWDPKKDWCWLDAIYGIGYVKLWITMVKFTPQIVANFRNKSTTGWAIDQILLDFVGGILSVVQLGIDSHLAGGDWFGVMGNPVKFALGNVSMFYDVIFMTQEYVLYPKARRRGSGKDGERDALLSEEEGRERRLD